MGRKKKPANQKQLEVLSARVNTDLYQRIEHFARRGDLNITQVVRAALREFLQNHHHPSQSARGSSNPETREAA